MTYQLSGIRPKAAGELLHRHVLFPLRAMAAVVAWGQYLNIYHLLYSRWGVVTGDRLDRCPVRLPAYPIVAAVTLFSGPFGSCSSDSPENRAGIP